MFSHIRYTYKYFGTRTILDLNNGGKIKEIQENITDRDIATIPILISNLAFGDYGGIAELNNGLEVDDIIDLDSGNEETVKKDLLSKIKQIMSKGVTIIDENELDSALKELGYTTYKFSFKNLGPLGDGWIATHFNGDVECDYTNFPRNTVNKEIADTLEQLYSQKQLEVKLKKYGVGTQDKPVHITDCFEEYTFDGKKYIRVTSKESSEVELSDGKKIEAKKPYWIEVEEKEQEIYHDISELQPIISDRRQGNVFKIHSEFKKDKESSKEEKTQAD